MLRFPSPVTSGFLGTIGFFLVRTALQISSGALDCTQAHQKVGQEHFALLQAAPTGVQFQYFYPVSFVDFFALRSMAPVCCLLSMAPRSYATHAEALSVSQVQASLVVTLRWC